MTLDYNFEANYFSAATANHPGILTIILTIILTTILTIRSIV